MKTKILRCFSVLSILSLFFVPTSALAASASPFVGHWQAIDVDGSDIRLTIAGPPNGPFNITWTESSFGFCDGEAGIARGTGWLREGDPYVLEADLHLKCFTTGTSLDFQVTWRYDPVTDTIAYLEPDPVIMTWHRPGKPLPWAWRQIIAHPDEEWVEGWGYEEGTVVSLRIFDPDRTLLYANTAEASFPEWDPENAWVQFAVGYDLKAGDHLWMTDGRNAKDLVVTPLEITDVNLIEHTVSGIATPGSQVILEYPPDLYFVVQVDQDGNWTATVEGLVAGIGGLASQEDEDGDLTRVGFYVPRLDLRVNYGHDWVESFYEAGHNVSITVTESDGVTVKATAEMVTEPQDFWGGESGFQTQGSDWVPSPPDIQPYDWVFAQVDNGQISQVQIGDISGEIDLDADSIQGTIYAPWFSSEVEVNVECHPWGAPGPAPMKWDSVLPDGQDTYACAWDQESEWDIQAGQDVGVGYFGPDGHWVANAFRVPNPRFTVFPEQEYIEGWEWPLDAIVHLEIEDPGTEAYPDYEQDETVVPTPWDPNQAWVTFNFPGTYDMKPGDVVTLREGDTTRTHTVQNLVITAIDVEADTVSGTAEEGAVIYVWPHATGQQMEAIADAEGTWQVDFSEVFDLVPGEGGRAEIRDEMVNATAVDWHIPNPWIIAFPEADNVLGYGWPEGSGVHMTIDDPLTDLLPDFVQEATVGPAPWDPNDIMAYFNFWELYDLKPGDVVSLSDGLIDRTYTVEDLAVTSVDMEVDTISGTAEVGAVVHVWPHAFPEYELQPTTGEDGTWQADFAAVGLDLLEGMCGRAEIRDEMGNSTAVDWCTPPPPPIPFIWADPNADYINGWNWPEGNTVTANLYDSDDTHVFSAEQVAGPDSGVGFDVREAGLDLQAGFRVILSDGFTTKELVVSSLQITDINLSTRTISGIYDPDPNLGFWINIAGQDPESLAFEGDQWSATFTELHPGTGGEVAQPDGDGDMTGIGFGIPNPRIVASITEDWFYLVDFSPEAQVTYSIFEGQGGSQVGGGTTTTDASGFAWVNFEEHNWDLEPGNYLVVTDETSTKDLIIEAFTFDLFDLSQGLLQGTAPGPPEGRLVWVGIGFENDGWSMEVFTDPDGNWVADFGAPVPVDYIWVAAQIFDEDGDASELRPAQIVNGQP